MGNFWAFWATAIWLLRLLLSLKYRRNVKILVWVILITIIFWIFTYDGNPISILPLLATAVSSYGYFFLEKVSLRLMLWFVSVCWLIYHTGTGSIAWLVNEIIMLITLWVTIYRFDPLTQITWFFGMFTILIGYFQKDDKEVKKYFLISAIFWGAHFYMLWVYSWFAAIVIWVARIILSLKFKRSTYAFLFIVISTVIIDLLYTVWYILSEEVDTTWKSSEDLLREIETGQIMIDSYLYVIRFLNSEKRVENT